MDVPARVGGMAVEEAKRLVGAWKRKGKQAFVIGRKIILDS